ncbi:MAG TPA: hypothetical protein VH325_00970 [Bryobacteraceae bacterium]|jgi:hypothetical protein|nr:hypothetical protein [Bryobacteraceae bacterium]
MPKQLTSERSSGELDSLVIAGLLESGGNLAFASHAVAIIAGFGSLAALNNVSKLLCAVSLLFWLLSCWFSFRVAIDASLFRHLAYGGSEGWQRLDELLGDWGLWHGPGGRTTADRWRGAIVLWRRQTGVLILQLATLMLAIVVNVGGPHV